jgi:hypothetical protein
LEGREGKGQLLSYLIYDVYFHFSGVGGHRRSPGLARALGVGVAEAKRRSETPSAAWVRA